MTSTRSLPSRRTASEVALLGVLAAVVALVTGHPAMAETLGGMLLLTGAIWAGSRLTRLAASEADSDRLLVLNLLLVVVVVVFLAGVAMIGLALPIEH